MNTQLTRPGTLPSVLLNGSTWNPEAVRRVSFEDSAWRAILVSDETGPVGAVCYSEPSIAPNITVDAVVMDPERAASEGQWQAVIEAAMPMLRAAALRFRATRIVFEAASPMLRSVLNGYGAREDSVTLSIGLEVVEPILQEIVVPAATPMVLLSKCGRPCASKAGLAAHERHCQKCKEA